MTDALLGTVTRPLATARPRLGFLGVGWIGLHRMGAIARSGIADIAAVADTSAEAVVRARDSASGAVGLTTLEELLELELDGLVIATPSAAHAEQAIAALERGVAVFCQKPLARTAAETRQVVQAARKADRLLSVDLSYRCTCAMQRIRALVRGGELGSVHLVDLVFHNAYGPDKPWFRDPGLSGGGCMMDLGIHLIDLAFWTLGRPGVPRVSSHLYAGGRLLHPPITVVEDHAVATIELDNGTTVRIACSWNAHAGRDAVIEASFYGTLGGATMRNVGGSFYDFIGERFRGTVMDTMCEPPDEWGGRAAIAWAKRLAAGARYDREVEQLEIVAETLDAIYGGGR